MPKPPNQQIGPANRRKGERRIKPAGGVSGRFVSLKENEFNQLRRPLPVNVEHIPGTWAPAKVVFKERRSGIEQRQSKGRRKTDR